MRTPTALAAAALVASVFLTTGCGDDGKDRKDGNTPQATKSAAGPAASSAAAVATGDLNTAVQELTRTSYRYTLKAGDASGSGSVDPATKQSSMGVAVAGDGDGFRTDVLILDAELYLKITGLTLPGVDGRKWLRVDRGRIKSFTALGIQDVDDPTGVRTLAKTIATIQKTGERSYRGTLDLSKGSAAFGLDDVAARQLGEQAKAVPFEATVNDKGKLASWKMTVPPHGSQKETPFELTYTDHGGTFPLEKPAAGQVTNPPDAVYEMLQV